MTDEKLNKLEQKLHDYQGEDRMVSSVEFAEMIASLPKPVIIHSGFPTLDGVLNGFEGGELVVVSGPTNHGKTTLLMSILVNMSANGQKSSFFTLENSPRSFVEKVSRNGVPPLFYLPMKNEDNQIEWLVEKIVEGCVKFDTRVVFIDHLHQIFSMEKMKGNLSLEIGDVVAKLKQIAVQYGIVIFLVAHCTDNKMSAKYEPGIRDIRDSGMISRLADTVLGVWRVNKAETKEQLFDEKVAEQDRGDGNGFYNKVAIWKSRREGKWGTFFCEHDNHQFRELDLEKLPKDKLSKVFPDTKLPAKRKSDDQLGF